MLKIRYYYFFPLALLAFFFIIENYTERPPVSQFSRSVSYAIPPENNEADSLLSDFHLITRGSDALLMRLSLIETAKQSLDLQYYSFQDDETGKLLLEALLCAADRGVRVRILVDDITIKKSDETWALLNAHPNIELRLFNPFATRDEGIASRIGDIFTHLGHFTKRMHNKVFIADNRFSIMGGRNLGDAYFGNNQDFNFRDIDIFAVGPITAGISENFDKFWNGNEAYPFNALHHENIDSKAIHYFREKLAVHWQNALAKSDLSTLPALDDQLKNTQIPLVRASATLAADTPNKIEHSKQLIDSQPLEQLEDLVTRAKQEFIVVSPYFVPGDEGMEWLKEIEAKGVKVRILTNSLASTDVVAVHAGYRRYRKTAITDGAELYEMKPLQGKYPRSGRFASASRVSLHTKIYVIDRRDIVIGTMNLDPRSIQLNTEIALIIHSPELAQQLVEMFDRAIAPLSSYHVTMDDSNLEWTAEENGQEVHYNSEPKAGFWRSMEVRFYALLPFENQL